MSEQIDAAGAAAQLDSDVRRAVIHAAVLPLADDTDKLVSCVEADYPLQESEEYQRRREISMANLESIKQAMQIMISIQLNAVRTSGPCPD